MKKHFFYLSFLSLFLLSSCAPIVVSIVPFNNNETHKIYGSSIGIIVTKPNKKLEFSESLYKVLYYEMAESFYDFEGLWDPSPLLEKHAAQSLMEQFNFKTFLLSHEIESANYHKIVQSCENEFNLKRTRYKGTASSFLSGYALEYRYNNDYLTSPPDESLIQAARKLNLDYIMEIPLTGISMYSHTQNWFNNFQVYAHARLISVINGNVIWAHKGTCHTKIKNAISPNDLEAIKIFYGKAIKGLCTPNTPNDGASFTPNSYVFKKLLDDMKKEKS